jgi:Tol biopolymer transport system component
MRWLSAGIVAVGVCAAPAHAQYFGQNKVQHRHLDFSVIQTEHFDVYYYEGERAAAVDGARMAERIYARLSRLLNHRYRERQPLIFFASHSEFQQNNVTNIGETTGGVTEPFRHRVLLPFTGSYAEFEHVLQHEIVHQFQFDIFARGNIGAGFQRLVAVNPPLWFMEGLAEYLSLGPINSQTAMWLRDAALEGGLPTIEQLTYDPRYTPYRYGHALWSYVGERWGDESVAQILHAASISGVGPAFSRTLGLSLDDLSEEWHDAVQRAYLPLIADLDQARRFARPMLTRRRSSGTVHISPSLSPDGSEVVYLSEGNSYWIDLYLADAGTGRVKRRLIKSAFSSDFESLRFLNSTGSWSPDGRLFAFAAKRGGTDDLVIFDIGRNKVVNRIAVPLNGLTTPTWSPDGTRLAFTGYDGGLSDLFVVNSDGTGLERLTQDRYADLHPAWSPDGRYLAFATDRGPRTDLTTLRIAPLGLALYDLEEGLVALLPHMSGQNTNPQWSPDGRAIAFMSDRTGIPNVFLYESRDSLVYQLTDVYTGIAGVTPLSPAISWATRADRLVFTYYEGGEFNVYGLDNPRSLKREPWDDRQGRVLVASLTAASRRSPGGSSAVAGGSDGGRTRGGTTSATSQPTPPTSLYRTATGFRPSGERPARPTESQGTRTLSVKQLLDSTALALPDSSEFTYTDYAAKLSADYVIQPTVGYVRDNFGSGVYGGSAISFSDMLGNHRLLFAGLINGRIDEAQVLATYANLSRRANWAVGIAQDPIFYYNGSEFGTDTLGNATFTTRLERLVVRQAFLETTLPFNRFRRVEFALRGVNVSRAAVDFVQIFDPASSVVFDTDRNDRALENANFVQPSVAVVFDNSASLWVGPFIGRRSRFEYAPAFGNWSYHQFLGDYRRYDRIVGPFTLATRALFVGRFGRDDDQFPLFMGTPELIRGYTSGSLRRNECVTDASGSVSGCGALDQLIGSRIAVANAELRFPLLRSLALGFAPVGFPPIEGAVFIDAGMAWNDESVLVLRRSDEQALDKERYRTPLVSWGFSVRSNVLGFIILRADYAKPLSRTGQGAYWTLSIGPTF